LILVDTSAWIEFLRGTGSEVSVRVRELLGADQAATTDVVVMEVVAGARDAADEKELLTLLDRCHFIPTDGPQDYEDAAAISRVCRQAGDRVRWLADCLIATVAIRADLPILTVDTDFEAIARHTPLQLAET
jgi:predicted nucleic acid-binding protein